MPLILRIDVDKPYGNHTLIRKLASKFFEETALPIPSIGYLSHLRDFLDLIEAHNVQAIFYFRICTIPNKKFIQEMVAKGHKIGWHTENTRNKSTFTAELEEFKKRAGLTPHSFSKHGSGVRKLGRYHYPLYEADKYMTWSQELGIPFYFGNDPYTKKSSEVDNYFEEVFWIERNYRDHSFDTLEAVLERAQTVNVPIITHPENVVRDENCKNDLQTLIQQAKARNISWNVF